MNTKVILFTMDGCPHCSDLMNRLNELSIPFKECEITKNRNQWETVVKQTQQDLLPTVFILEDDNGNGVTYTPGRDFNDLDHIIYIIKNSI